MSKGDKRMIKLESKYNKKYFFAILAFVILSTICVVVFLASLNSQIDIKVKEVLINEVTAHQNCLESKINVQYQELEGISKHITNSNVRDFEIINNFTNAFVSEDGFDQIIVAFEDGVGYPTDGGSYDISNRNYYQDVLNGKKRSSEPVDSIIDGLHRLALSVPIYEGDKVIGMVMGSFDMAGLSEIEFSDIYDNKGFAYIFNNDGDLILNDKRMSDYGGNVFDHYRKYNILTDQQIAQIRNDAIDHKSGCLFAKGVEADRYIVYVPLTFNDWVICYSVPVTNAFQDYQFIIQYEIHLIVVVTIILLLTLGYIVITIRNERRILSKKADYDGLTGLYNRNKVSEAVKEYINSKEAFGLAILDIDDFKNINDTYGHPVGDVILRNIADILKKQLNKDFAGRLGGDEFVIIVEDVKNINLVIKRLEQTCSDIAKIQLKDYPEITVTCSCGLAVAPKDGETVEEIYKAADSALYIAKSIGKNKLAKY